MRTLLVTKISSLGMPESRTARPTSASLPYICAGEWRMHGDLQHHPWKALETAALGSHGLYIRHPQLSSMHAPASVTHLGRVDVPVAKLEGTQHRVVGFGAGCRLVHACKAVR